MTPTPEQLAAASDIVRLRLHLADVHRRMEKAQAEIHGWQEAVKTVEAQRDTAREEREEARAEVERLRRAMQEATGHLRTLHTSRYNANDAFTIQAALAALEAK